ncbi:hypothetical protein M422DRAFT_157221 [Sphaerobolus stellatus SS14]|nr:hypothetical protein M422DRAFT_157221 [Sphaerobolus stellatus SS14]
MEQDNEVIEDCCKLLLDNDKLPVIVKLLEKYRRWSEDYWDAQTKAFHVCARLGLDKVLEYILYEEKFRGYGPNIKDTDENTPLAVAAIFGKVNVVRVLLDSGRIDVGSINARKLTPLHEAAIHGHEKVVELLVKTGKVDPDLKDEKGLTALYWAARHGYGEVVVKLLLKTGKVDPDLKDEKGHTPLYWAARYGLGEVVELLSLITHPNIDI